MKQRQRFEPWRQLLFSAMLFLTMGMAVTACSSDEDGSEGDNIHYTAKVLAFDSSENLGRAKIIHSVKDDKLSERLRENAQFLFTPLPQGNSYNLEEGCIIAFKVFRQIIPNIDTGLFVIVEIEITKIERK